jgi:ABC-type multidrug transport system fused ATPase/permease subunit
VAEFFGNQMVLISSRNLHKRMLHSIMRSKMSFFEKTHTGRILNRFSRDLNAVETSLPESFKISLWLTLDLICTLFIISTTSASSFIVILVPVIVLIFVLEVSV